MHNIIKQNNQNLNIVNDAMQEFELYVKIMSHQNIGKRNGLASTTVLSEYGLQKEDWLKVVSHWKALNSKDSTLGLQMISLLEKYNAHFTAFYNESEKS